MRKQQGRVGGDHQRGSKGFYIARAHCRKEFQRRLAIQGFSHTATVESQTNNRDAVPSPF